MPLQLVVDKLDSVPEPLRAEYTEKDGKFHLNVDGLEDTGGLKTALQKERDARKAAEKEIAAWKKSGKSAEEIAELVAAQTKADEEAARKAGNFDALLKQHKEKSDAEIAQARAERDAAFGSERSAIIENRVMTALTKAKATTEGMDLLTERLGKRIHIETVDGKRVTTIMQTDGKTPLAGSNADGSASYDDLVTEAKKAWPSLFEGTGAGGGGKQPNASGGKQGDKTITRAEYDKLSPHEQRQKVHVDKFKLVD